MGVRTTASSQARQAVVGHERTDAQASWIFGLLFLLGICGIALHFVVVGMQNLFERQPAPADQWPAGTPAQKRNGAWTGTNRLPLLQVSPPADLNAFRAAEETRLNSYGWIDRTSGIVHIPITRAMALVLEKGLPTRQGTNPPAIGPSSWELQQQRAGKDRKVE